MGSRVRWGAALVYLMAGWAHELVLEGFTRSANSCDLAALALTAPVLVALTTVLAGLSHRRRLIPHKHWRAGPPRWLWAALAAGLILSVTSALSLSSLLYIDFRSRLVLRACKPVAVAVASTVIGRRPPNHTWVAAVGTSVAAGVYVAVSQGASRAARERGWLGATMVAGGLMGDALASLLEHEQLKAGHRAPQPAALAGAVNGVRVVLGLPAAIIVWSAPCHPDVPWTVMSLIAVAGAASQLAMFESLGVLGPVNLAVLGSVRKVGTLGISALRYGPSMSVVQACAGAVTVCWGVAVRPVTKAAGRIWARGEHRYARVSVPV
jgi:drug/metabolite transporter (DMT)-like permease